MGGRGSRRAECVSRRARGVSFRLPVQRPQGGDLAAAAAFPGRCASDVPFFTDPTILHGSSAAGRRGLFTAAGRRERGSPPDTWSSLSSRLHAHPHRCFPPCGVSRRARRRLRLQARPRRRAAGTIVDGRPQPQHLQHQRFRPAGRFGSFFLGSRCERLAAVRRVDLAAANAANTPGFAGLADKLTDSADDVLRVVFQELASGRAEKRGYNDRSLFATAASSPGMGGASIQELQLVIGRFSLIPPTTPLASGGSPQVDLGLTLRVIGQAVPEPAGLAWFAAATAWIGRRFAKRRWSPRT